MKSAPHIKASASTPKYQAVLAPIIIEAIMASPATGVAPHFMNRAARIAFLIRGYSAGSGRMGRTVCRLIPPAQRVGPRGHLIETSVRWPAVQHILGPRLCHDCSPLNPILKG